MTDMYLFTLNSKPTTHIRSFVCRSGRSKIRQRNTQTLYQQSNAITGLFNFQHVFKQEQPIVLDIGFGMGDTLLQSAIENIQINYLGIEMHRPGIERILNQIEQNKLSNIMIIYGDAVQLCTQHIVAKTLAGVQLFFPDPWPKTRHHKRRLIQLPFINTLQRLVQFGGTLQLVTDWQPYAQHIRQVFVQSPHWTPLKEQAYPISKFAKKAQLTGLMIHNFCFTNSSY